MAPCPTNTANNVSDFGLRLRALIPPPPWPVWPPGDLRPAPKSNSDKHFHLHRLLVTAFHFGQGRRPNIMPHLVESPTRSDSFSARIVFIGDERSRESLQSLLHH